jgi:uncharacterized protein (TIGR02757 family)
LEFDPLRFPHQYARAADQEVVALIAAVLAYGNARAILGSVSRVLDALGPAPASLLDTVRPLDLRARLNGFRHRWTSGLDVAGLLWRAAQAIREHGSLGALFLRGYTPEDPNVGPSLTRWVDALLEYDPRPVRPAQPERAGSGVRYLLPRPADGSACKRLNLLLRWMVRRDDGLDLGLWSEVSPSGLVIPLDTHSSRVARGLGLTQRATMDWRAAEEVTRSLRKYDPDDPVRYDFALCHVSMSGDWAELEGDRRRGRRARLP